MSDEPVYQREALAESPAIHVVLAPGVDPRFFRWVQVGAEEEGVPCRLAPASAQGLMAAASEAAQASRLGVGVGVGADKVLLHEAHMPAECPVWEWAPEGGMAKVCRLAGGAAGRFVKRMPLRLEPEPVPAEVPQQTGVTTNGRTPERVSAHQRQLAPAVVAGAIARVLERRGLA